MTEIYQPGTVAMLTAINEEPRRAWLLTSGAWMFDDEGFYTATQVLNAEIRALAVIDPESDEDLARLWGHFNNAPAEEHALRYALREYANPTPATPEPTLPEAKVRDAEGRVWDLKVMKPAGWCSAVDAHEALWGSWSDLPQPVEVLFEGLRS